MTGEFERIAQLVRGLPPGEGVVLGAGDDAAVLRPEPGRDLVATTDAFVEGRHWAPGRTDAETLGRRLAAANLSDLAAMGARPRWALLSLALRRGREPGFVAAAQRAFAAALAADGAAVVGGNLAATDGPEVWSMTLLGDVAPGRAWMRSGARAGDVIAVTGHPGRAAAVLAADARGEPVPEALRAHWSAPPSRVSLALALAAAGGVTAAIDVSDGFAADLAHLARASGVDIELEADAWPADPLAAGSAGLRFAPGDDYELLLALDPARAAALVGVAGGVLHIVGRCTAGAGRLTERDAAGRVHEVSPTGWDHFAG